MRKPKLKGRKLVDFGADPDDSGRKNSLGSKRVDASSEDVRAISIKAAKSSAPISDIVSKVESLSSEMSDTTSDTTVVDSQPTLAQSGGDIYSLLAQSAYEDFDSALNDGDLPDPIKLVEKAIAADLDPSIFTERAFPVAPNVIDWCRSPEFLGYSGDLFPKQIQILAHFFCDVCYFCSDTPYIHDVPVNDSVGNVLDRFVLLQHGVCPKCKRNRTELLRDWHNDPRFWDYSSLDGDVKLGPLPYNEFVGVWGQRSSKSYIVSTFAAPYILHRYLVLPSPARYFSRPSNDVFEATFVAPTLHQTSKYTWSRFREAYETSPWFKSFREYLKDEGRRLGIQLYHSGATFVTFPTKRIALHMLAANSATLRGGTRIIVAIDELGHFNFTDEGQRRSGVKDGMEVYASLSNSLLTIQSQADARRTKLNDYNTLDAYIFNISSPASVSDPIMQLASMANRAPRMYYTHFKTWEVNPNESEEALRSSKPRDVFLRDFCAIPPRAVSPFIQDSKSVYDLTLQNDTRLFKVSIVSHVGEDNVARLRPTLSDIKHDQLSPRVIAVDNGEVNNSFALCIARYSHDTDDIIYEEFVEVAPYRGHSVDLAWCYDNFIIPLLQSFRFLHVCFDRWNSAYAINDLRANRGIDAQIHSLKWPDFENYRDSIRSMRMKFPAPEVNPDDLLNIRDLSQRSNFPRAHFLLQATTVNQFGRSVIKPDNGNDDLFRVSALAHRFVTKFKEDYRKLSAYAARNQFARYSVGTFRGASGRGRQLGAEVQATAADGRVFGMARGASSAARRAGRSSSGFGGR